MNRSGPCTAYKFTTQNRISVLPLQPVLPFVYLRMRACFLVLRLGGGGLRATTAFSESSVDSSEIDSSRPLPRRCVTKPCIATMVMVDDVRLLATPGGVFVVDLLYLLESATGHRLY